MTATDITAQANHIASQAIDGHRLGVITATQAREITDLTLQAVEDYRQYEDHAEAARLLDAAAALANL